MPALLSNSDANVPLQCEDVPRHRPLIPVLAGYCAGVFADGMAEPPAGFWILLGLVTVGLLAWGAGREVCPWGCWVLAALAVVPVGGGWHRQHFRVPSRATLKRFLDSVPRQLKVRGRIVREPELLRWRRPFSDTVEERWRLQLDARGVCHTGENWRAAKGGLTVFGDFPRPKVAVGDRVEFVGRMSANRAPTNPGERDFRPVYKRNGSIGAASVSTGRAINILSRPAWYSSPGVFLGRLRSRLKERLIWESDRPAAPLGIALMFGERGGLTRRKWRLMAEAGSVHFLAISGLHVGIFAAFVWFLLLRSPLSLNCRAIVLVAAIWTYVAFMGSQVSACRAAWMVTFVVAAPVVRRQKDHVSALVGAGLLILLLQPEQLFGPGFQFTFAAVWALFFIFPQISDIMWPWRGLIERAQDPAERNFADDVRALMGRYLALAVCVWISLSPLLAHHFHRYSLLSPVVNLFLWPFALFLIMSSFALMPLAFVSSWGVRALVELGRWLSHHITSILRLAEACPGFSFYTPGPPAWWVFAAYLVFGLWTLRDRLPAGRRLFVFGVLALGGSYCLVDLPDRPRAHLEVTLADVGHGQCAVFRLPSGDTMICDSGSSSSSRGRAIADMLWAKRVREIGALIVSHRDADHCSFLPFLNRRFDIEKLLTPPLPPGRGCGPIETCFRDMDIERRNVAKGTTVEGGGLRCVMLHPDQDFLMRNSVSDNDRSLVVRYDYRGWRFLFPGDASSAAIRHLVQMSKNDLGADVLVMPHHGSWSKGLEAFVEAVNPAIVLVSTRRQLTAKTRQLLRRLNIPAWSTAVEGAVTMKVTKSEIEIAGYSSGRRDRLGRSRSTTQTQITEGRHARPR